MKILFWILALLSIPAGLFLSFICYLSYELGLAGTGFGEAVCIMGMLTVIVCIVGMVMGIIKLRKGDTKKALVCVLVGLIYCASIVVGLGIDDMMHTKRIEDNIARQNEQIYGENWNSPPAVEGIPEEYQEELNKIYVAVRDAWSLEELQISEVMSMCAYYGDAPLDNIGFALNDLNGDGVEELIIGTAAPVETGGTAIFCIYSDPQNPFASISSVEGDIYYLHSDGSGRACVAEISGQDAAWILESAEDEVMLGITYQEGTLDPADRLTLEMIPFSRYK